MCVLCTTKSIEWVALSFCWSRFLSIFSQWERERPLICTIYVYGMKQRHSTPLLTQATTNTNTHTNTHTIYVVDSCLFFHSRCRRRSSFGCLALERKKTIFQSSQLSRIFGTLNNLVFIRWIWNVAVLVVCFAAVIVVFLMRWKYQLKDFLSAHKHSEETHGSANLRV